MHVRVAAVPLADLGTQRRGRSSAEIRARVELARDIQRARYAKRGGATCNAHVSGRALQSESHWTSEARSLLHSAADSLLLSARGYHRVIKVARTIADLDSEARILPVHVAEALRYRPAPAHAAEPGLPLSPSQGILPHTPRPATTETKCSAVSAN
jgi:magnesium chelatase family protein